MEGGDEDLDGGEAHPAVVGAARGGQLDHLLHQQILVEENLELSFEYSLEFKSQKRKPKIYLLLQKLKIFLPKLIPKFQN